MTEHILFIIDGLPGGGAENVTLRLANGLHQSGYQISILSLDTRLAYTIPDGINYLVDADHYQGPLRRLNELNRRAKSMDKVLQKLFQEKNKPALVISNLHKTDRIVVKSKVLADCNVWHCIHGIFSQSYLGNKSGLAYWIKKEKIKKTYKNRKLVCVSDAVSDDLKTNISLQPAEVLTIYNPFDFKEIKEKANQDNPYHGIEYLLHVGRFHVVKRHDRLLEAFAKAELPCKLLIVGKGEEQAESEIKQKISELNLTDKVILAGFHANPLPIIREAKAVVISSDSEGLPTVLIEALICHTPIVSTQCSGGVNEIMTGELTQYLSQLTPDSLAEKMQLIYNHPPVITEDMYKKFDSDHILRQYVSLIDKRSF